MFTETAGLVYSKYLQRQCNFNPFFETKLTRTGCYMQVHKYLSASVGPFSNYSKITELFFPLLASLLLGVLVLVFIFHVTSQECLCSCNSCTCASYSKNCYCRMLRAWLLSCPGLLESCCTCLCHCWLVCDRADLVCIAEQYQ